MNLRRCFVPLQLLFLLIAGLAAFGVGPAFGQETITLRNGQTQQVVILGVTTSGIKIQMGGGVMVQPFGNVASVTMNPPAEYAAAEFAYEKGDLKTALANAQSVVGNYLGLPTDWAQNALLTLGDIYIALNQIPQAEAVYNSFRRAYPAAGTAVVNVGLARIDVSKKDYDAAKAKIDPILADALKQRNLPKPVSALIGRAYYVSGQIEENAGDFSGALEDYLRTVAVFPDDRVAAANAQERADSLRKDHEGLAVP